MPTAIKYRSYAKINLYLDVLGLRRDGYHNIETVFQTVSLADELVFNEARVGISLECSSPELDSGPANMAYRAAALLKERTGYTQGAHIELKKHIPIAAGLAGGSSDAATTLVALNTLWNLGLSAGNLIRLALELGSDVPYCTIGGTVAATRRGEELVLLPPIGTLWLVLLHPPITISTSRVYHSPRLTYSSERSFAGRTRPFRKALCALERGDFSEAVFNRLEQVVFADHPHLAEARKCLIRAGCVAAAMTGSGPTLYGICRSRKEANRIADDFSEYPASVVSSVPVAIDRVG